MAILDEIDEKLLDYTKRFDKIPTTLFLSKDCYNVLKYFLEVPADREIIKFKQNKKSSESKNLKSIRIEILQNTTKTLFLI